MAASPSQKHLHQRSSPARPICDVATLLARAEAEEPGAPVLRFQPIWSVHQKAVGTYLCEMIASGGEPIAARLPGDAEPSLLGRLDRLVLRRALTAIDAAAGSEVSGAVCIPVHYRALADAGLRQEFAALCNSIAPEARSLLVWEMVGVPDGTLENPLFSMASIVKPHGRSLFIRCDLDSSAFEISAAIGIHSIGVDLHGTDQSETSMLQLLSRFAEQAHGVGLRCHAHGLGTSSLGLAAIANGFDYVSGTAISDHTEMPWGILPYDAESLFLHKFV